MFKNKLRTSGSTILSAVFCVLIGLFIGFIILVALAAINLNKTYQENLDKYNRDMTALKSEFEYLNIIDAKNWLDENGASEEMLAAAQGRFTENDLKAICTYVKNHKRDDGIKSPDGGYYSLGQIEDIISRTVRGVNADKKDLPVESLTPEDNMAELAPLFLEAIFYTKETPVAPVKPTFGDIITTTYEKGFLAILQGGWYSMGDEPLGPRNEIADAAPLIMTGLSVAFAFMTGLFNIGAAGQFTVGVFGALVFAILLKCPWYVCMLAAIVFGAVWGAIPGIFKAYFNVNEVITSIMFNWIGLYAVNSIMFGGGNSPMYFKQQNKTYMLDMASPGSKIPDLSGLGANYFVQPASIAIFFAILIAVILWIMINKTTFGYELKACGHSKTAAKYAGINEKRNIILSMTIAGALAGLGGALYCLSGTVQWEPQASTALPAVGFNGISVALLASSHPIGSIFSALFISHITAGGSKMNTGLFPKEVANIISGVIIYLCAFMMLFRNRIARLFSRKQKGDVK